MCSAIFRSCLEPLPSLLDEAGISRDQLDHVGLPHLMHIHKSHGHFTDLHMLKFPFLFFFIPISLFQLLLKSHNLHMFSPPLFCSHSSPLTPLPSFLTPHSSPLTPPPSLLLPHSSPSLLPHSSPLTPPPHSSSLTPPPSLLTTHYSPLTPHTLTQVLLAGGSCKIPRLQQLFREEFPSSNLHTSPPPDVAIATGCALQASIMVERGRGRSEGGGGGVSGESGEGGVEVACVPADLWISVS